MSEEWNAASCVKRIHVAAAMLQKTPGVARARPCNTGGVAMMALLLLGAAIMAIRDLTRSERQHAAIAEARKLADSGAYHDYTDIEYVLRFDHGLSDVSTLLDSPGIHRDLNRRCADARERRLLIAV
jgi:hypothetical protein